ncbi:arachidonate 15-lipoxygenase B-like [Acipenser oxyrinchus oxyrinchus]|uniref:Arachidonate 15-lipoxygenase B-like n=1 Tax=Acipenser oxyrinchus oxyrinchus TaxID=40147 RepID=A0AAD8FYP2_ACIOX|nr:arachidonate 15-lipoxygenase B-like [Acipenser oxyrinchus oxyrinchus]
MGNKLSYAYHISVITADCSHASTIDSVSVTLIGTKGQSNKMRLDHKGLHFFNERHKQYKMHCKESLGDIVLVRLEHARFQGKRWFCSKVIVEDCAGGRSFRFPYNSWVKKNRSVELREGTAKKPNEDELDILKQNREKELDQRRKTFRWKTYAEGMPKCVDIKKTCNLPLDVQFSFSKNTEFQFTVTSALVKLKLVEFIHFQTHWRSMADIENYFGVNKTEESEFVKSMWEEDTFFGYQFLNGCNPIMIKKCKEIPSNFAVTNDMVSRFLEKSTSLENEMQKGNIYLVDYQLLDEFPANTIHGKLQYLPAPLCLLYKDPDNQLKPIAIQLKQKAHPQNPIFLPSHSADWLLAKIYVRSADFNYFQLITHLLRTHLLAEVFCMATHRNLASVHPLYKLLIPHTRYTLQVNIMARDKLLGKSGVFQTSISTGGKGLPKLLQKAHSCLTYSSLCLPEDIAARGVEDIPCYYYRQDGMKLWNTIKWFVEEMIKYYYPSDRDVIEDTELQDWVKEIFSNGFLNRKESGISESFRTVHELIKFLTMVLFTCSVQHNAVNGGQFDFAAWMPNASPTLRRPPPSFVGGTTQQDILESIADVGSTVRTLAAVWLLSRNSDDFVKLGDYPEERFTEETPRKLISEFQTALQHIDGEIALRNKTLNPGYPYLRPALMENSVAI